MPKWPSKAPKTEASCTTCGQMPCMCHGGKMMAEGGEVDAPMEASEGDESAMNDEISHAIAEEFSGAMDRKDKKGMLESFRALVQCCKE
jgi:hypothetical protein